MLTSRCDLLSFFEQLIFATTGVRLDSALGIPLNFDKLDKGATNGIYKTVSFSTYQCFFIKHDVATSIVNKIEFSALNKMEKSIEGKMIKDCCVKLKVDRLGNISPA